MTPMENSWACPMGFEEDLYDGPVFLIGVENVVVLLVEVGPLIRVLPSSSIR